MDHLARRPHRTVLWGIRMVVEVALVALIATGLSGVVLGRILPALGHPVFVVAGPSMEPALPLGSAVVLETVPQERLAVGDVVSLHSGPGRAVFTHRIVRIAERDGERWVETRGDANAAADPSITPMDAVVGRVGAVVPGAGYLLTMLSAPAGVLLILSLGATLMVLAELLGSLEDDRRRRTLLASPRLAPTPILAPAPLAVEPARLAVEPPPVAPSSAQRRARRPATLRTDAAVAAERRRLTRARATGRGA